MMKLSKPAMPSGEALMHRQKAQALDARADLLRARASLHHAHADVREKREGKPSSRYMDMPVPELAPVAKPSKKKMSAPKKAKPAATAKPKDLAKSAKAFGAKSKKK